MTNIYQPQPIYFTEAERDFIAELCAKRLDNELLRKLIVARPNEYEEICCVLSQHELAQLAHVLKQKAEDAHDAEISKLAEDLATWVVTQAALPDGLASMLH